ncbi:MAG: TonB-dependent receptor [Bacteroidota bacterium]
MHRMKLSVFFAFAVIYFFTGTCYGQGQQRYTISGYIYEKGSRETLVGANVYEPNLRIGSTSNTYGFYSITLPQDSVEVVFSYVGYAQVVKELVLTENVRLDIELDPSIDLQEVVLTEQRITRISQAAQMSRLEIPIQQMRNIPTLLGEKDMFKVLQLMPGVQSGTEGTSGFYVRGGGPDQNLIILDDAIVYNASHLFGFFSVFNGDAVKSMQLYKGGFPARYGGRLSSVLDIQMKDGNKQKFAGEGGIGLISSRLTLEGPIIKDKASFLVSGRRSYIDALIRPFMPSNDYGGYYLYDLNAKLNYDIDANNRIFVSSYMGRDKFFFRNSNSSFDFENESEGGLYWQNLTTTVRWNHIFNDRLFANASFIFSDYLLEIYAREKDRDLYSNTTSAFDLQYNSGIQDIGLKYDITWNPLSNHLVRAGIQTTRHKFTPSAVVFRDDDIGRFERSQEIHYSLESGIYVEDEISFGDIWRINPGVRFSHFLADGRSYQYLEPRFNSNLIIYPEVSWKASFASMNQYVHLLSTTGIGLPTDLWVPTTGKIPPQRTWQVATGFAWDWLDRDSEISIEGYYKKSDNIVGYKEGASFLFIDDPENAENFTWEDNITNGEGWAYGIEFLLQRKAGRFSGWLGYTLSWIQHRFDDLNFGEKFWARYDRRHDISLVGIYEISPRITLSATWVYATGNAYDLGTGRFPIITHPLYDRGESDPFYDVWWNSANVYDKKNSFRAASYQRLDVGVQFHKDITRFGVPVKRSIELGAYNAYSRKNPFFYYGENRAIYDESGIYQGYEMRKLMQVSIFPIVPSISVNYKF